MAKSKIIITYDKYYRLPQAKIINVSLEDILDASNFLRGITIEEKHRSAICGKKKKRTNKLLRFIRRLFAKMKMTRTEKYLCTERVVQFPLTSSGTR